MAKIKYWLSEGVGEWLGFSNDERDGLDILLSPSKSGYVMLDNTAYRVERGAVRIPFSALADGEYHLTVYTEGEAFKLEGFALRGGKISMLPTNEQQIRRLLFRMHLAEEKIKDMEKTISDLVKKTEGHHIFTQKG